MKAVSASALALLLVLPILPFSLPDARADTAVLMSAALPYGGYMSSAVWDGTSAYIFGGGAYSGGDSDKIVRYTPSTNSVTVMGATFPTPLRSTSAVWDGAGNAYIFGGHNGTGLPTTIYRYRPATDTLTVMGGTLPTGRMGTSAVWDGTSAYVFGGHNGPTLTEVVRYTPATDTVTVMGARFLGGHGYTSAVWDGAGNAYIFGSWTWGTRDIVRYTPATDTLTVVSSALPYDSHRTSAVWDGTSAYVFGPDDKIVRYTPATNAVTLMGGSLLHDREETPAVWTGTTAYVFGLCSWVCQGGQEIVKYNPYTPWAPQNLAAVPGPSAGRIRLDWQAPASSGTSAITGYNVYRTSGWPGYSQVATVGPVLTYTDSGLSSGVTYTYYVTAVSAVGESPASNTASSMACCPPTAPQDLTAASGPGGGQNTLSWQAPASSGAGYTITSYKVYRSTLPGQETLLTSGGCSGLGNVLTCADTGLTPGQTYYYTVKARNSGGFEGPLSNEASATACCAPTPPQDPTAFVAGASLIDLDWSPPADDGGAPITSYKVYRSTVPGAETLVLTGDCSNLGTRTFCQDDGLEPNTTYYYQLTATSSAGLESGRTAEIGATTLRAPSPPRDLNAHAISALATVLSWRPSTSAGYGRIAAYEIWVKDCDACSFWLRDTVSAPDPDAQDSVLAEPPTIYVDDGVAPGTTNAYYVKAVNTIGDVSGPSNVAVAAALALPNAPPSPEGYAVHSLYEADDVPLRTVLPGESVGHLTVRDAGPGVCFDVTIYAQPENVTRNLACAPKSFMLGLDAAIPRGPLPLGTQGMALGNATVSVAASYRWDESRMRANGFSLLDGTVNAYAPVSPGDSEWFVGPGGQGAGLVVEVVVSNDGQEVARVPVLVPFVGQALASAANSAGGLV